MQRFSAALGHLVYKTEYALVFTAPYRAHQAAFKIQPERLIFILFNISLNDLSIVRFKLKAYAGFRRKLLIIYYVLNRLAVDTQQGEAGLYPQLLRY